MLKVNFTEKYVDTIYYYSDNEYVVFKGKVDDYIIVMIMLRW